MGEEQSLGSSIKSHHTSEHRIILNDYSARYIGVHTSKRRRSDFDGLVLEIPDENLSELVKHHEPISDSVKCGEAV